ncbi:tryptophan--tRNA ligase [Candidatus Gracilibacteria bacterium]|nr:tryptophan--tRNA ligase [Candidatus Gracilibacteria bacterium]
MSHKIITGLKPTGSSMHLGNLMGAVLPFGQAAIGNDAAIFVADLHAVNTVKDGELLKKQTEELAVELLAIHGSNPDIIIFRESDIIHLPKMSFILQNVTPYSLMLRAHAFKDAEAKNSDINMGTFNYPILMTADILGYDVDAVPVGKDQLQHLEMSRDIARNFNSTYKKEIFKEPEAMIVEALATLPGTDGRKMSKSYDNFIGVFDDEKTMKKRVMSIMTDSLGVDDIKNPDTCNVFALINVFGTSDEVETIRQKYLTPNIGFGYGHAKSALLDILQRYLSGYREARENLLKHPEIVEEKLRLGAIEMNKRLDVKMQEVREVVGVN